MIHLCREELPNTFPEHTDGLTVFPLHSSVPVMSDSEVTLSRQETKCCEGCVFGKEGDVSLGTILWSFN